MKPCLLLAAVLSLPTFAQDNPYIDNSDPTLGQSDGLAFTLFGGYTQGGDNFITINYTDDTREHFRMGNRFHIGVGALWEGENFGTALNLGYHFNFADGTNGKVDFERYTVELLPYYRYGRHKFSVGAAWHLGVRGKLDVTDTVDNGDGTTSEENTHVRVDFDDAIGAIIQYDYQITHHNWVSLRYEWIDYDVDKVNGVDLGTGLSGDGDHFGIYYRVVF